MIKPCDRLEYLAHLANGIVTSLNFSVPFWKAELDNSARTDEQHNFARRMVAAGEHEVALRKTWWAAATGTEEIPENGFASIQEIDEWMRKKGITL